MADLNYTRRFGDRKDGRLLRSLTPFDRFMPFVMKTQSGAASYSTGCIEVTQVDKFIKKKRQDGYPGLGILHFLVAAYIRTVAACPELNRFVSGQRIYARHKVEVILTVKRTVNAEASETTVKAEFSLDDTVLDIYRKLNERVDAIKTAGSGDSPWIITSSLLNAPRAFIKFVMWALSFADYFGWLPQGLLDSSPFHGSMAISDLSALGSAPVFQHLYDFGNVPIFITFGAKRKSYEWDASGQLAEKKYIDYTITMDERICNGYYSIAAMKYIDHFAKNPQALEIPPENIRDDVF